MPFNNKNYNFLSNGGEMGKLMREKDWTKTVLGSPDHWPKSLQVMVAVMLENPFPMLIVWGKEYTQLYNDNYIPILGSNKHPTALGNQTKETFHEVWPITKPMLDAVFNGSSVRHPDMLFN